MSGERPSLPFRLAVVVGGTALVLGLVAAVLLAVRGEANDMGRGPGLCPRIRVSGVPSDASLRVLVRFPKDGALVTVPAEPLAKAADVWVLAPPIPERGEVTVVVEDAASEPPRVLMRRSLQLVPAAEIPLDVRSPAPPR